MVREGSAGEQAEQNALGARAATAEKGGGTPRGSPTTTGRRAILLQDNRVLLHLAEKRLMEKEAQPHLHTKATRSGQMGGERVSELHEGVKGEKLCVGSHGRGWRADRAPPWCTRPRPDCDTIDNNRQQSTALERHNLPGHTRPISILLGPSLTAELPYAEIYTRGRHANFIYAPFQDESHPCPGILV